MGQRPPHALAFSRQLRQDTTEAEKYLWEYLRNRRVLGVKFRRQYPVGKYVLDFFCPEIGLAVEIDGSQHLSDEGLTHDQKRDAFLASRGIFVLRVFNHDVLGKTEVVLQAIAEEILARKKD